MCEPRCKKWVYGCLSHIWVLEADGVHIAGPTSPTSFLGTSFVFCVQSIPKYPLSAKPSNREEATRLRSEVFSEVLQS